ncbi:MAG: ATP-grasp domain-containing protein [Ruthenibacterium sp.]
MSFSQKIIPVLIGADMNCYTVARAFHEAYGVTAHAFGRWPMGDTMYSRIVHFTAVPDIDSAAVLCKTVTDFAAAHTEATCVVLGCTDDYASLLMDVRDALPANCIAPYLAPALRDKLVNKADFYALCDSYALPYPKTFLAREPVPAAKLTEQALGFSYPIILKPSSSILYWKHPFDGMKKVYTAKDASSAEKILATIYGAGYDDIVILQDMIPGDDSFMHVLTAYVDKNSKVKMMCLGHVGLEEHTPKAIGNHAAIITEYNEPLMTKLKAFLEDIGYTGFANFDIKYDTRDGSYRVFEINLRQGRSNYYVTGAGYNLAQYVVEDRVLGKDLGACAICKEPTFWHSVPRRVVYRYVRDPEFVAQAKALKKAGRQTSSFGYAFDLVTNPKRLAYYLVHMQRYFKKFKTYGNVTK